MLGSRMRTARSSEIWPPQSAVRWASLIVPLISIAVLIKNAWVAEDAFIVLRVVEQLWAGNGAVFNAAERVQVYTSPLWFLLLAAARAATADPFVLVLGVSLVLWLAFLVGLAWIVRDRLLFVGGLLIVLLSSSFFDFAASGLENPLGYVVLLWTVGCFLALHGLQPDTEPGRPSRRLAPAMFFLSIGVLMCVRHDLLTLVLVPTLFTLLRMRRTTPVARLVRLVALAAAPLAGWSLFSIVYYGVPLPNTAYAKLATGVPRADLLGQGLRYLLDAVQFDPATALVLLTAVLLSGAPRTPMPIRSLGIGLLTNIAYVVWVGGDFMRGRFLSFAFLVALLVCLLALRELGSRRISRVAIRAAVGLLCLSVVAPWPRTPLTHPPKRIDIGIRWGITDERAYYFPTHRAFANLPWFHRPGRSRPFDRHRFTLDGREFRDSDFEIATTDNAGTFAYVARLDQQIVDVLALTDPLLARLPAIERWRIGHFRRWLPAGYLESLQADENQLEDPFLRELHHDLRLATRAPLADAQRWRAILRLNSGRTSARSHDSYLVDEVVPSLPVYRERLSPAVRPPADRVRAEPRLRDQAGTRTDGHSASSAQTKRANGLRQVP